MLTRVDHIGHLRTQLRLLSKAAAEYDRGDVDESINISIRLRVTFHHTQSSTTILDRLGVKRLKMLSTATRPTRTAGFWSAITDLRIGWEPRVAEFIPRLSKTPARRLISIDHWWHKEYVYVLRDNGLTVTRRDIVTAAANQAGGAHVAAAYDAKFQTILEGAGWSITYNPDNGPSKTVKFQNAHHAALRQIAYEVLNSPDILTLVT